MESYRIKVYRPACTTPIIIRAANEKAAIEQAATLYWQSGNNVDRAFMLGEYTIERMDEE